MRNLTLLLSLLFVFNSQIEAQSINHRLECQDGKFRNFIEKNDLALGASYTISPVSVVQNVKYEVKGIEINTLYYIINRIGLEANLGAFKYNGQANGNKLLTNPEHKSLDNKNLILAGARIRYNFAEKYHCASLFLVSGYGFGHFEDKASENLHRWEVIGIGTTGSFLRHYIPNLDLECRISLTKDNLQSGMPIHFKSGLIYQFGKISNKPNPKI